MLPSRPTTLDDEIRQLLHAKIHASPASKEKLDHIFELLEREEDFNRFINALHIRDDSVGKRNLGEFVARYMDSDRLSRYLEILKSRAYQHPREVVALLSDINPQNKKIISDDLSHYHDPQLLSLYTSLVVMLMCQFKRNKINLNFVRLLPRSMSEGEYWTEAIEKYTDANKIIDGKPVALTAARIGNLNELQRLIADGADVNSTDTVGFTPLFAAAGKGHLTCIETLLKVNADVNYANNFGETALLTAAYNGHTLCVDALIKAGAEVNSTRKDGCTALYFAAQNGHLPCVEALMKAGAEVNSANKGGRAPLYCAASEGHHPCVEALMKTGADVNRADKDGVTPLNIAAHKGHLPCVEALMKAGADVNIGNKYDVTPLITAARASHLPCVLALLDSPNCVIPNNYESFNQPNVKEKILAHISTLPDHEQLRLLGDICDKNKSTPLSKLMWLRRGGYTPSLKRGVLSQARKALNELKAKKSNANKPNGRASLAWDAASNGDEAGLKKLIEEGADVNVADENDVTPLIIAARNSHTPCILALLDSPNCDIPDNYKIFHQSDLKEKILTHIRTLPNHEQLRLLGDICNENKKTPLSKLMWLTRGRYAPSLKKGVLSQAFKTLNELKKQTINENKPDDQAALLLDAAYVGDEARLKKLIDEDVEVNSTNKNGNTPLFIAAQNGHLPCVEALMKAGANVNGTNKNNATPLFIAAQGGHLPCIKYLLTDARCNINATFIITKKNLLAFGNKRTSDIEKRCEAITNDFHADEELALTACDIARIMGHDEVVTLLESKKVSLAEDKSRLGSSNIDATHEQQKPSAPKIELTGPPEYEYFIIEYVERITSSMGISQTGYQNIMNNSEVIKKCLDALTSGNLYPNAKTMHDLEGWHAPSILDTKERYNNVTGGVQNEWEAISRRVQIRGN